MSGYEAGGASDEPHIFEPLQPIGGVPTTYPESGPYTRPHSITGGELVGLPPNVGPAYPPIGQQPAWAVSGGLEGGYGATSEPRRAIEPLGNVATTSNVENASAAKDDAQTRPEADQPKAEEIAERLDLQPLSAANTEKIRTEFVEETVSKKIFPDAGTAKDVLQQDTEAVRKQHAVTVNMSPASMKRLLEVEKLESYWGYAADHAETGNIDTANGKAHHEHYGVYRKTADDALRRYAPADVQNNEPVYAAIAGRAELEKGAADQYGNWWVELSPEAAERAVYHFSDSHGAVTMTPDGATFSPDGLLTYQDALEAKAVTDIVTRHNRLQGKGMVGSLVLDADPETLIDIGGAMPGYVECAVFDEVTLDSMPAIGARINTASEAAGASPILRNATPKLQDKLTVTLTKSAEPLMASWVKQNFRTNDHTTPESAEGAGPLWEYLGVAPTSTYDEIRDSLQTKAAAMWPRINRIVNGMGARHFRLTNFAGSGSWDSYINNLQRSADSRNLSDPQKAELKTFLAVQQARVFFS